MTCRDIEDARTREKDLPAAVRLENALPYKLNPTNGSGCAPEDATGKIVQLSDFLEFSTGEGTLGVKGRALGLLIARPHRAGTRSRAIVYSANRFSKGGSAMRKSFVVGLLLVLLAFLAAPGQADQTASCDINCHVGQIMEWGSSSFGPIDLAHITAMTDEPENAATVTLYTNGDVDISADVTDAAQLSNGSETLVTEYKISDDGGSGKTGGLSVTNWTGHTDFLSSSQEITHESGDGNVDITLEARARIGASDAPDMGDYSATQTLTAAWIGS